jgi:hypothetical protein
MSIGLPPSARPSAPRVSHLPPVNCACVWGGEVQRRHLPPPPPGRNDRVRASPKDRVGKLGQHPPCGKIWLSYDWRTEQKTLHDWSRKGFRSPRKSGRRRRKGGREGQDGTERDSAWTRGSAEDERTKKEKCYIKWDSARTRGSVWAE